MRGIGLVAGGGVGGVVPPVSGRGRVAWEEAGRGAMAMSAKTAREPMAKRDFFNTILEDG